jgi:multiple sugar transport system permease protein
MITSLIYAFHDYMPNKFLQSDKLSNFGVQHFKEIFTYGNAGLFDEVIYSLYVTFRYTIVSLALQILGSYCVALFLNQQTKGIYAFRIIYYLPNLIPGVAGTLLWKNILDPNGYLNLLLKTLNLPTSTFYTDASTVLPTMLFTGIFSWGGTAIMWLSQMQNVPKELYESAELDGARYFQKTFKITIPMTTSMMFYVVVTSMIGGIQTFASVYPLFPVAGKEVQFIVVYIYQFAFNEMGHTAGMSMACALSWVLFVIIAVMTSFIFKTSKWVYYGEEM